MRWFLLAIPAFLLVACGGGSSQAEQTVSQAEQTVSQAEPTDEYDPDRESLFRLVFWDSFAEFGLIPGAPPALAAEIETLATSDHPGAAKYLIDLAGVPTPYSNQILDLLGEQFERPNPRSIFSFPELFQFAAEDSQTDAYLAFKQVLYGSIIPQFSDFLNPLRPRTIDAREVVWGGVGVDVIPPLESPGYVSAAAAAAWINDSDDVVGLAINGDVRAFPVRIIAWHEMLNDTVGGIPVTLAYCTLCGSAIVYDGRVGEAVYDFGTSGLLYRSNKLMYDRTTKTLWEQFTGEPAWGTLVDQGLRLTALPSTLTTWGAWRDANPGTLVLDIETGFERDYSPGAAYADYNASDDLLFNVPIADDRLDQKDEVFVLRAGDDLTAYPIELLATLGVVNDVLGELPVVVAATANGRGARAYERGDLEFVSGDPEAGTLTDADGRVWRVTEDALERDGALALPRVSGHNSFWFAVVNHSTGRLYEG